MNIWMDADACPRGAKDLLYRAAKRESIPLILVANQEMGIPKSAWISKVIVEQGFDIADAYITDHVEEGDLVITADIPLAANVVDKGAIALDPRGLIYDEENVKEKLATRNLLASLRDEGMMGGGPPPYQASDRHKFASALNVTLQRLKKEQQA